MYYDNYNSRLVNTVLAATQQASKASWCTLKHCQILILLNCFAVVLLVILSDFKLNLPFYIVTKKVITLKTRYLLFFLLPYMYFPYIF